MNGNTANRLNKWRRGWAAHLGKLHLRAAMIAALFLSGNWDAAAQTQWTWRNPLPPAVQLNAVACGNGKSLVFGNGGTVLVSSDASDWDVVPSGTNRNLYAAVYAAGQWTAVGEQGVAVQSADAATWSTGAAPTNQALHGICFGNGRYVAVGGDYHEGTILSSGDGLHWTTHVAKLDTPVNAVAYGNGVFVAVGYNSLAYTSPDGATWTPQTLPGDPTYLRAITFGEEKFVAAGLFGVVRTSLDGVAWTSQTATTATSVDVNALTFAGGFFYGACANQGTLISDDAVNWSYAAAPLPSGTSLLGVGVQNGLSIWAGTNGALTTTLDQTGWNLRGGGANLTLSSLAYGNGVYVGVAGYYTCTATKPGQWFFRKGSVTGDVAFGAGLFASFTANSISTSTDGTNWTTRATNVSCNNSHYAGGRFFLFGYTRIYTSIDGLAWQSVALSGLSGLNGVAYGNGVYVAVGNVNTTGEVRTSPDGVTWTSQSGAPTPGLTDVAFGNGLFAATAIDGSVYTSANGAAWTRRTTGTARRLMRAAWNGSLFVVSGEAGTLLSSPDGVSWTDRSMPTSGELRVLYTGQEFVATGTRTVSSTDGKQWVFRSPLLPEDFLDVTHGHAGFIAVSRWNNSIIGSTLLSSADGIAWKANTTVRQFLGAVGYANGLYFAGGDSGALWTSPDGQQWTQRSSGVTATLRGFSYGSGVYVAVGGKGKGEVLTSPDGVAWTVRSTAGMTHDLQAVTYAGGLFVAVGGDSYNGPEQIIMTSPDGATWTVRSAARITYTGYPFRGVAYGNGAFVAAGDSGVVATSPDGVDWTTRITPDVYTTALKGLRFLGGRFFALRPYTGELVSSPDGLSWTSYPVPAGNSLTAFSASPQNFVAAGTAGSALTSPWTPPTPAPANVSVAPLSSGALRVTWADAAGEQGYVVERKPEPEGLWSVAAAALGPDVTSFTDSGLGSGKRYAYRVRAIYPAELSEYSAAAFGSAWTMSEQWRQDNFGSIQDSGDGADLADPDGDGIPNLLERAFGLPPKQAGASNMFSSPYIRNSFRAGMRFFRDPSQVDLEYEVQTSDDLKTWTAIARSVNGQTTAPVGQTSAVVSDYALNGQALNQVQVSVDFYGGKRFFRVVVRRQ